MPCAYQFGIHSGLASRVRLAGTSRQDFIFTFAPDIRRSSHSHVRSTLVGTCLYSIDGLGQDSKNTFWLKLNGYKALLHALFLLSHSPYSISILSPELFSFVQSGSWAWGAGKKNEYRDFVNACYAYSDYSWVESNLVSVSDEPSTTVTKKFSYCQYARRRWCL